MITKCDIKKVEELQKVEKEIKNLKEDYEKVKLKGRLLSVGDFHEKYLYNDYRKDLSRIIYHRIKKMEKKRKNMLKGENDEKNKENQKLNNK